MRELWGDAIAMIPARDYSIRLDGSATGCAASVVRHDGPPVVVCHANAATPSEALSLLIRRWRSLRVAA